MGLLGKLIPEKDYEHEGVHHVRITDEAFEEALEIIKNLTQEQKQDFINEIKEDEEESHVLEYHANDFHVVEILATFDLAYMRQEEINNIPLELRRGNVINYEFGRKDWIEYEKYRDRYNDKLNRQLAKGGYLGELGEFEKYTEYVYGDSQKAKGYLLHFAKEFGHKDKGLLDVISVIRARHMIWEFFKWRIEVNKGKKVE